MARTRYFVCIVTILYLIQFLSVLPAGNAANQGGTSGSGSAIDDYYVTPTVGDETTVFTYYAFFNYTATYPREVKVKIDGKHIYNMTWGDGHNQYKMSYKYETKLGAGTHNFTILYNDYYSNWTTQYETNVSWDPTVYRNEVYLNQTSWNSTKMACSVDVYKGFINASVEGDLIGTVDLTDLELVIINQTSFDGKGFGEAGWEAEIETNPYNGTWKSVVYRKAGERRYYLKGTVDGGVKGTTEGYLTESTNGSGVFDVYNATWTICKLGKHFVYADLFLNGTVSYKQTTRHTSSIYIIQASFAGVASGYYNKSLTVVLTQVRIANLSDPYFGQGFSIISYNTVNGTGLGWTVDNNASTAVTTMNGYFTEPLLGIVTGELNESGKNKTLYIYFYRIKLDTPPRAKLIFYFWGPGRVSPGQTVSYTIKYYNYGLKGVYGVGLEIQLPGSSKITYISNTGGGTFNSTTNRIVWTKDMPPESSGHVSVKIKVNWGLPQNSWLHFYFYVNITELTLMKHHKSLVTTARDPNVKHGPEGAVIAGQKLDYKVEYENEGQGIAFGVYFTDTLDTDLDDSTLTIGPVKSTKDNSTIAPAGTYDSATRTITWFVGEVGPGEGGYSELSVNVKSDAGHGTEIFNYATVYFPSVPEVTNTNTIVSIVKIPQVPTANAGSNKNVKTLEDVEFDASLSSDADGTIVDYAWDFGDGTSGNGRTVLHQYADDGTYTVKLTVEDDDGLTASHEIKAFVTNRLPQAVLDASPGVVMTLEDVTFDASASTDNDGTIADYYFDFGDGTNSGWIQTSTATHQYAVGNKAYTASLKVKDDDGDISTNFASILISVDNQKPIAQLSVMPVSAFTYEDIECSAKPSSDVDGTVSSYFFDFGDGQNSGWIPDSVVSHQYTDGTKQYTITLKVKDDHGVLSETAAEAQVSIKNRKPTASITADDPNPYTDADVTLDASGSSDMDGDLEYLFEFGDGSDSGWLTTGTTTHQYSDGPKEYDVKLTVRDDDGETDTDTITIKVQNRAPTADAGPDQTVLALSEVSLSGIDSIDSDGKIVNYQWSFGDGTTGIDASVTHSYKDNGIYKAILKVTDDDGEFDTDSCTITVSNNKPVAGFEVNTDTGGVSTVFEFRSTSTDIDGIISGYSWDFGDDTGSTEAGPTHQYEKIGEYTVTLMVTDDDGSASAGFVKTITVINSKPDAVIVVTPIYAEVGDTITFDASGSTDADNDVLTYRWDFGDGKSGEGKIVDHAFSEKGTFVIELTVTDDKGNEGTASVEVEVNERTADPVTGGDDKQSSWMSMTAVTAVILLLIALAAIYLSMRKRKPEDENVEEEEE